MIFTTFRGGIHLPDNKKTTEGAAFSNLSIPGTCYIPLLQHAGRSARPVVKVGDVVTEGQLVGAADTGISANVHSSVPGKVVDIREVLTVHGMQKAVVVEAEGSFNTWTSSDTAHDFEAMSREEILSSIGDAGIVGLGGAGFPTFMKLSPGKKAVIDTLIVNGVESEPYLTVDDMMMRSFPREIIEGVRITLRALGAARAVIGVDRRRRGAIRALKSAIAQLKAPEHISVKQISSKYPSGAEKILVRRLTGRTVSSGSLPVEAGVVVLNAGTIFAIREAVLFGKPLYERYLTVSGSMIERPGNYKVRVGALISDIIGECGGLKGDPARIIMGGPMCGVTVDSVEIPVEKSTSAILFLSEREVDQGQDLPCIRCGRCVTACPVGLLPGDLGRAVQAGRYDDLEGLGQRDCILCGSCAYICPAGRHTPALIRTARNHIKMNG